MFLLKTPTSRNTYSTYKWGQCLSVKVIHIVYLVHLLEKYGFNPVFGKMELMELFGCNYDLLGGKFSKYEVWNFYITI